MWFTIGLIDDTRTIIMFYKIKALV
uniref:Uncharacterized protein n=1 Tax=Anguilla anguilla TaxID=7936 RepID=A0A0E9TIP9_ANGAN